MGRLRRGPGPSTHRPRQRGGRAVAETKEQWALEPNPIVFVARPDPARAVAWYRVHGYLPYHTDTNERARFIEGSPDHG